MTGRFHRAFLVSFLLKQYETIWSWGDQKHVQAMTLLKRFAMKYYPNEQLADEEIAQAGKAVQLFEIEMEHLRGKEVQER